SLGALMAAEGRHFRPETVRSMQVALDLAWSSLSPEQQVQSNRKLLATCILDAAESGRAQPCTIAHAGADACYWPLAEIEALERATGVIAFSERIPLETSRSA